MLENIQDRTYNPKAAGSNPAPAANSYCRSTREDKVKFLRSYIRSYVKTEVQMEQLVRKLDPFRGFLEIAAQMSGKIVNFAKIARQVDLGVKTVQLYYLVLEKTYLSF